MSSENDRLLRTGSRHSINGDDESIERQGSERSELEVDNQSNEKICFSLLNNTAGNRSDRVGASIALLLVLSLLTLYFVKPAAFNKLTGNFGKGGGNVAAFVIAVLIFLCFSMGGAGCYARFLVFDREWNDKGLEKENRALKKEVGVLKNKLEALQQSVASGPSVFNNTPSSRKSERSEHDPYAWTRGEGTDSEGGITPGTTPSRKGPQRLDFSSR